PNWPTIRRVSIPITGLPVALDGYTIVQLSDLHRGPVVTEDDLDRAVGLALRAESDLFVLTGDFVSRTAHYALSCAQALRPLVRERPTLACLGNHDHWTDAVTVAHALTSEGITVLRNESLNVAEGLWVAAVDDVWERRADLGRALEGIPGAATIVLLVHEPDYADQVVADGRVHLQLSGHSHGGQVRLPFLGVPVLPYLARKYVAGRYQVGHTWLYVNRGIGVVRPAVRFNCRPEVTHLTLRRATGE
ncbi:MAG TPA: metallophosphoesterase, partial [Chloroflexi bacterium]|nr:metallophosphoesterase [Chloroflexota bacterium]